jgi:hypothetical protein
MDYGVLGDRSTAQRLESSALAENVRQRDDGRATGERFDFEPVMSSLKGRANLSSPGGSSASAARARSAAVR